VTNFFFDNLHTVSSFSASAIHYNLCPWEKGFPFEDEFFSSDEVISLNTNLRQPNHLIEDTYFSRFINNFEAFHDSWNGDIEKAPVSWFSFFFVWDTGPKKRFLDPGLFFTDLLFMLAILTNEMDSEDSKVVVESLNRSNLGQFALLNESGPSINLGTSPILNALLVPRLRERLDEIKILLTKKNMTRTKLATMGKCLHQKIVFATQPVESADEAIWYEGFFGPMEVRRYTAAFELKYPSPIYSNEWMPIINGSQ